MENTGTCCCNILVLSSLNVYKGDEMVLILLIQGMHMDNTGTCYCNVVCFLL